jgi:hypothetical protein
MVLEQNWETIGPQLALFIASGASVLALAAVDLWKRRDTDSLLLALWVFGTFLFTAFLNWTPFGAAVDPSRRDPARSAFGWARNRLPETAVMESSRCLAGLRGGFTNCCPGRRRLGKFSKANGNGHQGTNEERGGHRLVSGALGISILHAAVLRGSL